MNDNREYLLEEIDKAFGENNEKNKFPYHIYYLRFPFFKNYEENLKINFSYPITFITGTNGIGKSSLLHALYGSIRGYSPAHFWFETGLDPIKNIGENRHCIISSFKTLFTKQQVEILVSRISRTDNPDYWEPSEPLKKYSMKSLEKKLELSEKEKKERSKDRWNQQKRKVYYIDFRHMMGAYDKFFYFSSLSNLNSRYDIQKRIRKESKSLSSAFNELKSIEKYRNKKKNTKGRNIKKPVIFDQKITDVISGILGKKYKNIFYTEHDLYSKEMGMGFVIKYTLEDKEYSEAYAGSGESVVAKMIYDLREIEENSLILIDEPETSLHPQAQKRLVDYLLKIALDKKVQIVISTHSPDIIDKMPSKSINVLYETNENKVSVMENINYENAFFHIGHNFSKRKIFVEDTLAKKIIEKIIKKEKFNNFEVESFNGANDLFKYAAMFSKTKNMDVFFILDGDQQFDKFDIKELTDNQKNVKDLDNKIKEMIKIKVKNLPLNAQKETEKIELRINFLDFLSKYIYFLPKKIPEDILIYSGVEKDFPNYLDIFEKECNSKKKFADISNEMYQEKSSDYIFKVQEQFIVQWMKKENEDYKTIVNVLNKISII